METLGKIALWTLCGVSLTFGLFLYPEWVWVVSLLALIGLCVLYAFEINKAAKSLPSGKPAPATPKPAIAAVISAIVVTGLIASVWIAGQWWPNLTEVEEVEEEVVYLDGEVLLWREVKQEGDDKIIELHWTCTQCNRVDMLASTVTETRQLKFKVDGQLFECGNANARAALFSGTEEDRLSHTREKPYILRDCRLAER